MTLTHEELGSTLRRIADPATIYGAGYDEVLARELRAEEDEPETTACAWCGDIYDYNGQEFCCGCRRVIEGERPSAIDMTLRRANLYYAIEHGVAPKEVPYHLLNNGGNHEQNH